jgi:hypothetical protein
MSPEKNAFNVRGMLAVGAVGAVLGVALAFTVRAAGMT